MTSQETQQVEPVLFTSTTPAGIEILYSPAPRRYYKVRPPEPTDPWDAVPETPSVTTVLGCLDKPAMAWWGMKTGVAGVLELFRREMLFQAPDDSIIDLAGGVVDAEDIVRFLTQEKLTVNHVRDKAGDRGLSVHDAFEQWAKDGTLPYPDIYPVEQRGYVAGLRRFMDDFSRNGAAYPKAEVTVGSAEHGFAGRYDLRIDYWGGPLVTKCYPSRKDRVETVEEGKYLLDLKTSSGVYLTHAAQLAGYEIASVEDGYDPTDYQAVVHVTADGKYEFIRTHAKPEDFLSILDTYKALQRGKKEWLA